MMFKNSIKIMEILIEEAEASISDCRQIIAEARCGSSHYDYHVIKITEEMIEKEKDAITEYTRVIAILRNRS